MQMEVNNRPEEKLNPVILDARHFLFARHIFFRKLGLIRPSAGKA